MIKFGFWGCLVILVNVMDGPGFLAIPKVYREVQTRSTRHLRSVVQAGWLVPTLGFLMMAAVSCLSGFCVVDVYTDYQQNQRRKQSEYEPEQDHESAPLCDNSPRESTSLRPSPRGNVLPEDAAESLDLPGEQPATEFCSLFDPHFSPTVVRTVEVLHCV